jgi:hypothetical protein
MYVLTARVATLIAFLLLSAPAWSQPQYGPDHGQWQILGARYGTAQRNIDVTQRLRELARQDTTFQVTNRLFGSDPVPGVVKTLRIYARGPGGGTRIFDYFENDIVDGSAFTGWRSGNWGEGWNGGWGSADYDRHGDRGQWRILQARYGTAGRNIDVTQRLRELARQDARFQVRNDLFGNDPDPGVVKVLRIYARGPGGATRTFEYGENNYVDGSLFTGWSRGDWGEGGWEGGWGHDTGGAVPRGRVEIISAQYGDGRDRHDVTSRLNSMVRDGRISTRVTNDTMGSDPAPGRRKTLWVTYHVGGRGQQQTTIAEGGSLGPPVIANQL